MFSLVMMFLSWRFTEAGYGYFWVGINRVRMLIYWLLSGIFWWSYSLINVV